MARIRTIKPEFPQSQSMGRISREARLCFILLWTLVDDSGRTRASSRMLASLLYPYDDDAPALMDGWLGELQGERCIDRYEVNGNAYLQISKWLTHQKIDKPSASRLPEFDESSRIVANPLEPSSSDLVPRIVVSGPSTKDRGKKQKPSLAKASSGKVTDPRHVLFKEEIKRYMEAKGCMFIWDASEAKSMGDLLKAVPALTIEVFQKCLLHRARSPGTPHGERPRLWLPNILRYQQSPLTQFNRTEEVNGNSKAADQQQRNLERVLSRHEGRKNEGGGTGRGDGSGVIDAALRLDSTGSVGSLGSGSGEFDF